ncbi:MAG: hypothetical protein E2O29_01790 [Deltaproteobacteria bacterium]|nr:MAG: hypothetical protein E2O29_01790 [Deltaproteobacteria bacterium]
MLTRKDFKAQAEKIGQIEDYLTRSNATLDYSMMAKKSNKAFNYRTFTIEVEKVAQAKSDLKRNVKTNTITKIKKAPMMYTQEQIDMVYKHGYDKGYNDVIVLSSCDKTSFSCARCGQDLSKEHIERFSNMDKPRLDAFDHCKLVFDLYDYNDNCKK